MTRHPVLLLMLSILIVALVCAGVWTRFHPRDTDVTVQRLDNYRAVVHYTGGDNAQPASPLPAGVQEGDLVDLRQQSLATRLAFVATTKPLGQVIDVVGKRDGQIRTVQVTVNDHRNMPGFATYAWPWSCGNVMLAAIALLLIWRGRDRAAFGMGLWAVTFVMSAQLSAIPQADWWGFAMLIVGTLCYLTARVGFYIMVEARVAAALNPSQLGGFRIVFWVLLFLGAVYAFGGPVGVLAFDWDGLTNTDYGLVLTASYLVPIAMLYVGYQRAAAAERQRLRWMLASGILWFLGILVGNTPVLGSTVSGNLSTLLLILAQLGFLYALLRLRVVNVAVVIDRALVYGGMTTLVVGVIAAVNSLVLRTALAPGASLMVQVLVPLSLGIMLGRVRDYLDRFVEQVFFRARYLADRALRTFARRVGHMEDPSALLDAAAGEIFRHTSTPGLAIYSAETDGYHRVRQLGDSAFPERLGNDDAALVALRADRKAVDLETLASGLGSDGGVFPMMVLGRLRGAIVCRNRPGEHYAADEKKLLTLVAREVGAAWRILRARDNEALVTAVADGKLPPEALRDKARAISWSGG